MKKNNFKNPFIDQVQTGPSSWIPTTLQSSSFPEASQSG